MYLVIIINIFYYPYITYMSYWQHNTTKLRQIVAHSIWRHFIKLRKHKYLRKPLRNQYILLLDLSRGIACVCYSTALKIRSAWAMRIKRDNSHAGLTGAERRCARSQSWSDFDLCILDPNCDCNFHGKKFSIQERVLIVAGRQRRPWIKSTRKSSALGKAIRQPITLSMLRLFLRMYFADGRIAATAIPEGNLRVT